MESLLDMKWPTSKEMKGAGLGKRWGLVGEE